MINDLYDEAEINEKSGAHSGPLNLIKCVTVVENDCCFVGNSLNKSENTKLPATAVPRKAVAGLKNYFTSSNFFTMVNPGDRNSQRYMPDANPAAFQVSV